MDTTRSPYCRATVNYTGEGGLVPTEVDILDGRMAKDSLDRQQCGFELVSHVSRVEDWHSFSAEGFKSRALSRLKMEILGDIVG